MLIGRRVSLSAQVVIAVSSSGFTAGAIAKARKHGIILRDLQELTDGEIASWGQRVGLTLFLYEYSDLRVSLVFDQESLSKITPEVSLSGLRPRARSGAGPSFLSQKGKDGGRGLPESVRCKQSKAPNSLLIEFRNVLGPTVKNSSKAHCTSTLRRSLLSLNQNLTVCSPVQVIRRCAMEGRLR
jgi:hypothetical protein